MNLFESKEPVSPYGIMAYLHDVRDFHLRFGLPTHLGEPLLAAEGIMDIDATRAPIGTACYRSAFGLEELREGIVALEKGDLAGLTDALVDSLYVTMGTCLFYELNLPSIMDQRNQLIPHVLRRGSTRDFERYLSEAAAANHMDPNEVVKYAETGYFTEAPGWHYDKREILMDLLIATSSLCETHASLVRSDWTTALDGLQNYMRMIFSISMRCKIPFDLAWNEVQRANMAKVRASSAEEAGASSGRANVLDVIKPEGWTAPDIEGVLSGGGHLDTASF